MQYGTSRDLKHKDQSKLEANIAHLKRVQGVGRTWNFSRSVIDAALQKVNKDRCKGQLMPLSESLFFLTSIQAFVYPSTSYNQWWVVDS